MLYNNSEYYNKKPVEFIIKEKYELLEDNTYDTKIGIEGIKELANIPINEPMKYTNDIIIKAIKYGMIMTISYKGEKDKFFAGHERVIYPMVLGRSSKGDFLLRAWHFSGWSVSNKGHVNKIWRLFRTDRILSITFTGSFYRLAPEGYNVNDKGMRGGIVARAFFSEIRNNQQKLIKKNKIQNLKDISLNNDDDKINFTKIKVKDMNYVLDLSDDDNNLSNIKNSGLFKISFLKSVYGKKYIAILGALGQKGNVVNIIDSKNKNLGYYKVIDSLNGKGLDKIKKIESNTKFNLYMFDKKV